MSKCKYVFARGGFKGLTCDRVTDYDYVQYCKVCMLKIQISQIVENNRKTVKKHIMISIQGRQWLKSLGLCKDMYKLIISIINNPIDNIIKETMYMEKRIR